MGNMGRAGILALLLAAALVSGATPRGSGQQQGEQLQQIALRLQQLARRSLYSRARPGVSHGRGGRSLRQTTAPMCVFDEDEGCGMNDDMMELSMGAPTTDTQKCVHPRPPACTESDRG